MKARLIMIAVAALILGGCSANQAGQTHQQSSHSSQSSSSRTTTASSQHLADVKLSVNDAIKQFKQQFPNSEITELSVEKTLGRYQYEIEGVDNTREHHLKLNAQTGKVVTKYSERLDADEANGANRDEALDVNQLIGLPRAVQIAERSVKNQTAKEAALEKEAGQTFWEIQFEKQGNETNVKLNAQTGKVLEVERDD